MGKNRRQRKTLKRRRKQRGGAEVPLLTAMANSITSAAKKLHSKVMGTQTAPAVVAPLALAAPQPTAPATMGGKGRRTRSRKTSGCGTCQLFAGGRKRRSRRTRRRRRRTNRRRR